MQFRFGPKADILELGAERVFILPERRDLRVFPDPLGSIESANFFALTRFSWNRLFGSGFDDDDQIHGQPISNATGHRRRLPGHFLPISRGVLCYRLTQLCVVVQVGSLAKQNDKRSEPPNKNYLS